MTDDERQRPCPYCQHGDMVPDRERIPGSVVYRCDECGFEFREEEDEVGDDGE